MKSPNYKPLPINSKILNVSQDNNPKNVSTTKSAKCKWHQKQKIKQVKTQPINLQPEKDRKNVYKTKSQRIGVFLDHKNYQLNTCPDLQQSVFHNKRTPKSANKYPQSKSFTKTSKITQANSKKNTFFCKINSQTKIQHNKKLQSNKVKKRKIRNQINETNQKSIKISKTEDFFKYNHLHKPINKQIKSFLLFQQKKLVKSFIDCQSQAVSDRGQQTRNQLQIHPNNLTSRLQNYLNSVDMRVLKSMKQDMHKQVKKQHFKQIFNLQFSPIIYFTKMRRIPIEKLQNAVIKIQRFWRRMQKKKVCKQYNNIFNNILFRLNKNKQEKNQESSGKNSMLNIMSNSSESDYQTDNYQEFIRLIPVQQQVKQLSSLHQQENQLYKPYIDFGYSNQGKKINQHQITQKFLLQPHLESKYSSFSDYLNENQYQEYKNRQTQLISVDQPLSVFSSFYQSNNTLPKQPKNQLLGVYDFNQKRQNDQINILSNLDIENIQKYYENQCDKISQHIILVLIQQLYQQLNKKSRSLLKYQKDFGEFLSKKNSQQNMTFMKQYKKIQKKYHNNQLINEIQIPKNEIVSQKCVSPMKDQRLQRIQVSQISLNFYLQILIQIILNNYSYVLQIYDNMQYYINYSSQEFLRHINSKNSISSYHFDQTQSNQYKYLHYHSFNASYPNKLITISQKIHKQCCQYINLINNSQNADLLDIWYKCIYQCFNQYLRQYRPYGLQTPNYPWSQSIIIPHYFQFTNLGEVLQLVRQKIHYLMGYQIGTLFDKKNINNSMKIMNNFEQFQLNQQKIVCYLSEWLGEDTINWINYDTQKLVILLQICNIIYNILIQQIAIQILHSDHKL